MGTGPRFLLLGAGFSRNWGGWLTSDVFNVLLTTPEVQADPELQRFLWEFQNKGESFEDSLAEARERANRSGNPEWKPKADTFLRALREVFRRMNTAFFDRNFQFEFKNSVDASMKAFLSKFDAIFSLNQDLLLERHYLYERFNPNTFKSGAALPFISRPLYLADWEVDRWQTEPWIVQQPPADRQLWRKAWNTQQPVFKLHGSWNWRRANDEDTPIFGGGKLDAIAKSPLLSWYLDEFRQQLKMPEARLMTIGYGFQDQHINDLILAAKDLEIFVVDPAGSEVFWKPKERGTTMRNRSRFTEAKIIGISTAPLSSTFNNGVADRRQLLDFFA